MKLLAVERMTAPKLHGEETKCPGHGELTDLIFGQ